MAQLFRRWRLRADPPALAAILEPGEAQVEATECGECGERLEDWVEEPNELATFWKEHAFGLFNSTKP